VAVRKEDVLDEHALLAALRGLRRGDFRVRLPEDQPGIAGDIATTFNEIAELNETTSAELRRIARSVGREGRIGGRAKLEGARGAWARNVESINELVEDLTVPTKEIGQVLGAVARGDLSQRIPDELHGRPLRGEFRRRIDTVNTMVDQLNAFASEVTRVAREVGTEGKLGGQADVQGVGGTWKDLTDSVNSMAGNLTSQVRNIADVTTAVANGDLSRTITVDVEGEILELKNTINTMVDQLNTLAREVNRVAHEVGTEGKLGGQADVPGVGGAWKDLTDNINTMSTNLTERARNIAEVTTAVANGDLSKKITVSVRGEFRMQKDTINKMVDQLNAFASEVTRVAREVGTDGKLGGQAKVPGARGTWRDLTDNVNQLAANLTSQVRAMGHVATAVTRGDLTRTIQVEAAGEVQELADNVNEMIRNLRDTTQKNKEQDWLKTNLARFSRLLQGQRDLETVGRMILSELALLIGAHRGVIYLADKVGEQTVLRLLASFAHEPGQRPASVLAPGEGLVGQCALEQQRILVTDIPAGVGRVNSAFGDVQPRAIVVLPAIFEGETRAVVELASVDGFDDVHLVFLDQLGESIGIVLNTINANIRAGELVQEQAARAEAEAGLARLRQVIDAMPEGILIADAAGEIYLTNAAARELMGVVPSRLDLDGDGAPIARRLDGSICPVREQPLARAVLRSEVVRGEQLVMENAMTGVEITILVNSVPLLDSAGEPAGGVAVFQDISPLRDLDRQKDEFLAAVSHDLKTPATIIKGRANLLQRVLARTKLGSGGDRIDDASAEQFVDGLQAIDESTAQLVRLVDELLDLTRLRMGKTFDLDLGPVDIVKTTRRLATEYQNISPRHVITVESADGRLVGDWDEARIERVVANLISNAVKYSPRGGAIVVSTAHEERDGQEWARLVVRDSGLGIPHDELKRVFEPYYRGTNVRSISGTGVGLASSRHIVEQHGGEITVDSTAGKSTTVTVRLPLLVEDVQLVDA
jgi:PAS domain S-box-containing protein